MKMILSYDSLIDDIFDQCSLLVLYNVLWLFSIDVVSLMDVLTMMVES